MSTAIAMQLGLFTGRPLPGEVAVFADTQEVAGREGRKGRKGHRDRGLNDRSLVAHEKHEAEFKGRKALIVDALRTAGKPMTDRQIKERIFGEAADMNMVRPRINDLLHEHKLMVAHEVEDHVTHESVRLVWLA